MQLVCVSSGSRNDSGRSRRSPRNWRQRLQVEHQLERAARQRRPVVQFRQPARRQSGRSGALFARRRWVSGLSEELSQRQSVSWQVTVDVIFFVDICFQKTKNIISPEANPCFKLMCNILLKCIDVLFLFFFRTSFHRSALLCNPTNAFWFWTSFALRTSSNFMATSF